MKVDRLFWVRAKGNIEQAFSYNKDSQAQKFAEKYGGSVVTSLDVSDELESYNGEVYSYLTNENPVAETTENAEANFLVVALLNGNWKKIAYKSTISDANTEAKNIIKNYGAVAVVKV